MAETATEENTTDTTETPGLGDAGKKAIVAERQARLEAETELAELRKANADTAGAVKARLAAERELKALRLDAETRANAELTELERFKKENEELRSNASTASLKALRMQVALEKGLPANLAARLQGNDYDELAADADSLSELVPAKSNGQVRPDPSQGVKATGGSSDPAQAFAQALNTARGR